MSSAAVLMIHDRGNRLTERLGVAVYGGLLEGGPYAELQTLEGPEEGCARLAAAVVDLASRHEAVDVFLSIHTTPREPAAFAAKIPPAARRVRLVYTTACWGEEAELAAWARVGARAVVCHVGYNDPLVAMPCVLSRWIAGASIGEAVAEAYRETNLLHAFGRALPFASQLVAPRQVLRDGVGLVTGDLLSGSRPVIAGDPGVRCAGHQAPEYLRYDPASGGALGLAVRAAAGRFVLESDQLRPLLEENELEPGLRRLLEAIGSVSAQDGEARADLEEEVELEFRDGVTLVFEPKVTLQPRRLDVAAGELELELRGVQARYGVFSTRLRRLILEPRRDEGFQLRVQGTALGVVPVRLAIPLGGDALETLPDPGPLLRDLEGLASPALGE